MIYDKRGAIYELAKRDFEAQYKNTYLGIVWGFIHPLSYILVLLLVFTIGLRSNPGNDVPFVIYLISGMIPWQFFSNTLISLSKVVHAHSYLVKKGDLSLGILHVAKILSNLVTLLVLIVVCVILCYFYGYTLGFHFFQVFYYLTAMCLLLLGLGWITSSTCIFVEDISNVVNILIQFGFWFTPIIWNLSRIPGKYRWIARLNPACYIITGFRDSLIYKTPFWAKPLESIYFWTVTIILLLAGAVIFRRLKPHFGEVI
jgi:ABC-type polysaccharide/polyol phosphate export permease